MKLKKYQEVGIVYHYWKQKGKSYAEIAKLEGKSKNYIVWAHYKFLEWVNRPVANKLNSAV